MGEFRKGAKMGKLSKEECARFSGAVWLLEFAKEHGLEEAEKEVERRGIRNMPLKLKDSDVDVFVNTERTNIMNCLLLDTLLTLHDVFDFTNDDCQKFIVNWNKTVDSLAKETIQWKELRDIVNEELGIYVKLCEELEKEGHEG